MNKTIINSFTSFYFRKKSVIEFFFFFLFGILIFVITLNLPISEKSSYLFRHGFSLWLLGALIILSFSLRLRTVVGKFLTVFLILILFALPLTALWQQGYGEMQIIGGLLSFSDSARYYHEANRLLFGFPLTDFGARHPFYPATLAAFLWIMGQNLKWILAVFVLLNAISVFLASRALQATNGSVIASFFIIFSFLFFRRFIGMTDTENLGFFLGMLAFTLLWYGANSHHKYMSIAGLFFSSFALGARPGAYFLLPALLLWFYLSFIKPAKMGKWRDLGLAGLAILIPFLMNFGFVHLFSDSHNGLYSNYAYTLYGISDGGTGWEQIFTDFPETLDLSENQSASFAFEQAKINIKENPKSILQSVIVAYEDFFSLKHQSAYGFVSGGDLTAFDGVVPEQNFTYRLVRMLIWSQFSLGILWLIKKRKDCNYNLLLWGIIGILFSVPFLPPRDAAIMRVYAASMPLIILVPLMGLNWFLTRFTFFKSNPNSNKLIPNIAFGLGLILLCLMLIIPLSAKIFIHDPFYHHFQCQNEKTSAVIVIQKDAYIFIQDDLSTKRIYMPVIRHSDFLRSLNQMPYGSQLKELSQLKPPVVIMNALNLQNGQLLWVVLPLDSLNWIAKPLGVCGFWMPDLLSNGFGFLHVEEYFVLD
jgi:hypothetical protein